MIKKQIHFAHANGFPSGTYRTLFSFLEDRFEIGYLDQHAHNPDYPVTDNWEHLWKELAEEIEGRYDSPVVGLGHSFGGVLHLLASLRRPELYEAIVLLDAPIISRVSSYGIKLLKKTRLLHRYSPARATLARRRSFGSRAEALEHFRSKRKFAEFDDRVLEDYIEFGLSGSEGNFILSFEPEIEAEIYATLPDTLPKVRGKLSVPTYYIGGTRSREAKLARLGFMRKHFDIEFRSIKGSHLFPFEQPQETADLIGSLLH